MKMHTTGKRVTKTSTFRKAVLPLLIATVLGTSGAIATPALYAADDAAQTHQSTETAPPAPDTLEADASSTLPAKGDQKSGAEQQGNATADATAASPERSAKDRQIAEVSEEGLGAMQALHAARLSIFEGKTDAARTQLGKAEKLLTEAKSDATTLQKKGEKSDGGDTTELYIPIEGSLALADAFVPTEAHQPALEKANGEMAKKDTAAALDTLRLAAIDVRYTEVLVPLTATEQHVKEAKDFLGQGKFHEANLAMMKAEQGVVVNTVELAGTPRNG